MNTQLHNEHITITVNHKGAELIHLIENADNHEYMWSGDAAYWTGRSPVLFPIVGSLVDESTRIDGKTYGMKNHGFARKSEFNCLKVTEDEAVFELTDSKDTYEQYPYHFALRLTYRIEGRTLAIDYEVENQDDISIFYQIGTHPAFKCPMEEGESFNDAEIRFSHDDVLKRYFSNEKSQILPNHHEELSLNNRALPMKHEDYYEGALIFREVLSDTFTLASTKSQRKVEVKAINFPYLGIWQPKDAPFICIEPWHGLGDEENFHGDFTEKELIVTLQPGEKAGYGLRITI